MDADRLFKTQIGELRPNQVDQLYLSLVRLLGADFAMCKQHPCDAYVRHILAKKAMLDVFPLPTITDEIYNHLVMRLKQDAHVTLTNGTRLNGAVYNIEQSTLDSLLLYNGQMP